MPIGKETTTRKLVIKTVLLTLAAGAFLVVVGGLLLMASGVYNIAADRPHFAPTRWLLRTGRTRSVQFHSRGITQPNLYDPALIGLGLGLYVRNCQPCHGGPGVAAEQKGRGIDPHPPPLVTAVNNWTGPELYWIVSHGLKLSGMPGFAARLSNYDTWAVVAFLRQIVFLSPAEYQLLVTANSHNEATKAQPDFMLNTDYGFGQLQAQGSPDRGRQLLRRYGCITCHTIPDIGSGLVGPPLANFSERQYLAGSLVNVPANAVAWIMNPDRLQPNTAMPNLKVLPAEALDMAAYLYTLGGQKRTGALRQTAMHRP